MCTHLSAERIPDSSTYVTAALEATKSVLSQCRLRLSLLFAMQQPLQSHTALGIVRGENLTLGDSFYFWVSIERHCRVDISHKAEPSSSSSKYGIYSPRSHQLGRPVRDVGKALVRIHLASLRVVLRRSHERERVMFVVPRFFSLRMPIDR